MSRTSLTMRPVNDISDLGFRCENAANGGWVVWGNAPEHCRAEMIGAYSNTAELLAGLKTLLEPPPAQSAAAEIIKATRQ